MRVVLIVCLFLIKLGRLETPTNQGGDKGSSGTEVSTDSSVTPVGSNGTTSAGKSKPPHAYYEKAHVDQADIRDYPYHVQVDWEDESRAHFCSGVILTASHVLTAAQCVTTITDEMLNFITENKIRIRVGTSELSAGGNVVGVERVFTHPRYLATKTSSMGFDMAVLKTTDYFTFNENVSPLDFPTLEMGYALKVLEYKAVKCDFTGWGSIRHNGPSRYMMHAQIPLLRKEKCIELGRRTGIRITDETHICTLDEGLNSSCIGDSGSGLVCNHGSDKMIWGIMSFGKSCNSLDFPTVFTRVDRAHEFLKWCIQNGQSRPVVNFALLGWIGLLLSVLQSRIS